MVEQKSKSYDSVDLPKILMTASHSMFNVYVQYLIRYKTHSIAITKFYLLYIYRIIRYVCTTLNTNPRR